MIILVKKTEFFFWNCLECQIEIHCHSNKTVIVIKHFPNQSFGTN